MKIEVKRRFLGDNYTIGSMYIDGVYFCDTLEDKRRDLSAEPKIRGRTAIPEGVYKVTLNRSPRFGRDLPRLLDVPHFDGILIHRGNTCEDTQGCILVGENRRKGCVVNSTGHELRLVEMCRHALLRDEDITISVEILQRH